VALVETKISFLNALVSTLTLGIYWPMEIIVTCGSAEEAGETQPDDNEASPPPSSTSNGPKKGFDRPDGG